MLHQHINKEMLFGWLRGKHLNSCEMETYAYLDTLCLIIDVLVIAVGGHFTLVMNYSRDESCVRHTHDKRNDSANNKA